MSKLFTERVPFKPFEYPDYYNEGWLKQMQAFWLHTEIPMQGDIKDWNENFDKYVVGAIWDSLRSTGEFRIMILSDHATPVAIRTHTSDPAPFVMAGKNVAHNGFDVFSEKNASLSKLKFRSGALLTEDFIKGAY